ncbi:GTPase IMAP family member 8-like [Hoplias malabaricus]|uniref:GTPase IMAP family member 8-like n=1 Tax=Hoplias malabaricus TaxID=27720 RepID=UPI003461EC95
MASSEEESDLRVVLLGKNSSELSRVGNFILNRAVFDTEPPPSVEQQSERARGTVEGRYITLINTPHLFDTQLSQKLIQRLEQCVSLCAPGPHLIALVLQPDNFTKADRYRLNHILSSLSAEACKYTLVLTTKNLKSGPGVVPEENVSQKIIAEWSHRHVEINSETSPSAIVEMMGKMVEENGRDHLKVEMFEKSTWKKNSTPLKEERNIKEKLIPRMNLVVCGSNSELKSSISHHILGQRESSPESSSECVRKEGELCGRLISLVELPALYNTELSEEDVMRKALHCVSRCDPGVHAFLLIVPENPFTDEDRGEMEKIQRVFGPNFKNHTMAVIAKEPQQETGILDDGSKRIIETFSGYVSASDDDFSLKLLDQVEKILEQNNRSYYTTAEYLEAHVKALKKYKSEIEELHNTINYLQKKKKKSDTRWWRCKDCAAGEDWGGEECCRKHHPGERSFRGLT